VNLALVDQIAKAVLYEGYMLYPYRPSSVKNRQRFNFGVLYPQAYSNEQAGLEPCSLQTECLVLGNAQGDGEPNFELKLRFLHLKRQASSESGSSQPEGWQEAVEKEVNVPRWPLKTLCDEPLQHRFELSGSAEEAEPCRQAAISGDIVITAENLRDNLFKLRLVVRNTTDLKAASIRDEALMHSLVSAHLVLGVEGSEFVSLLEPPEDLLEPAAQCQNIGVWPVLVGDQGQRDTLLASPIILYDYPQIAPESAGDLFDGTEIDEILSLRIMTLTDDEKREIRQSDERARQILERTENMPAEQFMKLHGAVRGLRPVSSSVSIPPEEDAS
jgi:hypothetical protein